MSQLLGDYRSDGSESDEVDDDAGKCRKDVNDDTESNIDTSKLTEDHSCVSTMHRQNSLKRIAQNKIRKNSIPIANFGLDWTQCIDKNTGHPYYWNIVTKEVTWEIPDEYERFLRQYVMKSRKRHAKNTWILCQGDDQNEYYFNEYTRAISWDKPSDYVEPVEYVQPVSDEHNTAQQVRKQENAARHTQSHRRPNETAGKQRTTDNNNEISNCAK